MLDKITVLKIFLIIQSMVSVALFVTVYSLFKSLREQRKQWEYERELFKKNDTES